MFKEIIRQLYMWSHKEEIGVVKKMRSKLNSDGSDTIVDVLIELDLLS